ncbi:ParB/Srx family N-terminal domain-containing protein [Stutzerimonas sp. R40042]|uniref:ParB/Srx family N-terminal domain-containing protein n=1 Tax=Stutzerimonas TaxID=2901164 RepID=UPI0022785FB8|nr:ParB/Srx family N-terminal domain-containing protein [Stutzerimonas sp. R40042]WAE63598.1 ParB/Srx family N-terminal domain-containing protein [Stutzerimonas sp. R40042]
MESIKQHACLQNRNTTSAMRRSRQRAEERAAHISKLAQSIEAKGLEKPLDLVEMTEDEANITGQRYWLVGGHHRLEALQILKHAEVPAILLEGRGLPVARKHSYQQNDDIVAPLKDDQLLANAWRAINDPDHDEFRLKTIKEMAQWARLTTRTIDRMYEIRRRWAAFEQDIGYEEERVKAKEQGQRGIRAFNADLDGYCNQRQHLFTLYSQDYGMLKKSLERGTEQATIEERQLIARTVPAIMQQLNCYGLEDTAALRSVLKHLDGILAEAKDYYHACELAEVRYQDSSSAQLERYLRLQEDAERLTSTLAPVEEHSDF